MKPTPPDAMDLLTFQSFVRERPELFDGVHPESTVSLDAAELRLGVPLPAGLRWLLGEWGYSDCCGVGSLDEAVDTTLTCREKIGLPRRYFVLNDWGDAGIVYLDTQTGRVRAWADPSELHELAAGLKSNESAETFDDYPAWVAYLVERHDADA
jgi:hypothetical protein